MSALAVTPTEPMNDVTETVEPKGPQASFYVLRDNLDIVSAKAEELGVELELVGLDWTFIFYKRHPQGVDLGSRQPYVYADGIERLAESGHAGAASVKARCVATAAQYVHVTVHAPSIEDRVIGVATVEGYDPQGQPLTRFVAVPGEESKWDESRVETMDFRSCDICCRGIARSKVFLVEHIESGLVRQIGGKCASNLDLAKRMRRQLKALRALEAFVCGGRNEDELGYGGRGFDPGFDQKFVLVLTDMTIRTHGYVSGKAAWQNDALVSTKERVAQFLYILNPPTARAAQETRMERAELQHHLEGIGKDRDGLYEESVAFVEGMYADRKSDFTANLRTALYTGSKKMLGFLVWIPAGLLKEKSRVANRVARSGPWTPVVPTSGAELATYLETWGRDTVRDDLGLTDKVLDRAIAKPEKTLTKTLSKKLERHVPGAWKAVRVRSFEGQFGWTYYLTLVRVSDGVEISWKSSYPQDGEGVLVAQDDTIRVHTASVHDIPPARVKGDKTYQDGRRINRASVSKVTL